MLGRFGRSSPIPKTAAELPGAHIVLEWEAPARELIVALVVEELRECSFVQLFAQHQHGRRSYGSALHERS